MATLTAVTAAHATLTANVIDVVSLTGKNNAVGNAFGLKVTNETTNGATGFATIYVGRSQSDPAIAGNDTYAVYPGSSKVLPFVSSIRLISSGTPAYTVATVDLSNRLMDALEDEINERKLNGGGGGGTSASTLGTPSNPVTNASATRPSGLPVVYWQCATQPTNWITGDIWINNA